ncbi:MAG: hemin receptor [Flavobacteriales bacterium]|nr:MAG: hemin receptor [Flavobacteriales bacterium]
MIKKSIILVSFSVACYVQAQDVSVITNTTEVYANPVMKGSAKFDAMVGSNGALGGTANALLTNPAGLGVAVSGEVSLSLDSHRYQNKATLNNTSLTYKNNLTGLSNVGVIGIFRPESEGNWKFVNVAVNYSNQCLDKYVETPADENISFSKDLIDPNNNAVTGNLAFKGHAYNRTGRVSKFSLGFGANYDHSFYFGAGLNFSSAKVTQGDRAAFLLDLDNRIYDFDKQYTPYEEQASGISMSLGGIAKISNQLRLGIALETPTLWSMERVYWEYGEDNSGYATEGRYSEDRRLVSPFKTTLSAAIVPNKRFALNVDYTVGLTKPKYSEQGGAEVELNDFFRKNTKNTSELRVGAEYRWNKLRLRGGYAYANSPFESLSINTVSASNGQLNQPFTSSRRTLGLGIGYAFNSFFIDVAYQNVSSSAYQNPFMQGYEAFNSGYYSTDFDLTSENAIVSEVENKQNNVNVTLGWKF